MNRSRWAFYHGLRAAMRSSSKPMAMTRVRTCYTRGRRRITGGRQPICSEGDPVFGMDNQGRVQTGDADDPGSSSRRKAAHHQRTGLIERTPPCWRFSRVQSASTPDSGGWMRFREPHSPVTPHGCCEPSRNVALIPPQLVFIAGVVKEVWNSAQPPVTLRGKKPPPSKW
jgi:hypothetical protein